MPGSDATSRANAFAERERIAAGYPDAAARSTTRSSTYGYPAADQSSADIPGSEYARKRAEEAARASVLRPLGARSY
ncbi:hypothetical protein VQ042_00835 [Aurantimonas sp. A2-1-M11]|uniref:hypothetical protein n=1 Tax=Aurantimonas sp. A2-1-M11 TaxID=3113712 RepID=UPI002F942A6F